ncbi:MAG: hypothetical protein NVSMB46_07770 [Candidatus Saccharimonadales bacterium]
MRSTLEETLPAVVVGVNTYGFQAGDKEYHTGLYFNDRELGWQAHTEPQTTTLQSLDVHEDYKDRYGFLASAYQYTLSKSSEDIFKCPKSTELFTTSPEVRHGLLVMTRMLGICAMAYSQKCERENKIVSKAEVYTTALKSYRTLPLKFSRINGFANEDCEEQYGLRHSTLTKAAELFECDNDLYVRPKNWDEYIAQEFDDELKNPFKKTQQRSSCLGLHAKIETTQQPLLSYLWQTLLGHCTTIEWLFEKDIRTSIAGPIENRYNGS